MSSLFWFLHRDLSRNEIKVIHRDAFLTLTALTNLWVQRYHLFNHAKYKTSAVTLQHLIWLHVLYRILNCTCEIILHRDLSMNSLTVLPTTGLSALSQLKLSGNPQMKNVLTARNLPKLRWEKTFWFLCQVQLFSKYLLFFGFIKFRA